MIEMDAGEIFSWVMVRAIGVLLVVYSFVPLIGALGGGYVAYTLRDHAAIVIQSNGTIPDCQKDTPKNR